MKLIQRTTLLYQMGSSTKVYEVDLCEVGDGAFVVNFRYGRQGKALREGSKTVSPVDREEADRLANELIEAKVSKGYTEVLAESASEEHRDDAAAPRAVAAASPAPVYPLAEGDPRHAAIAGRLERDDFGTWRRSRVYWRVGEFRMAASVEHLLAFLDPRERRRGDRDEIQMERYCAIWALGRIGDERAVARLRGIYDADDQNVHLRRLAGEALGVLLRGDELASFRQEVLASLPEAIQAALRDAHSGALMTALQEHLAGTSTSGERFVVLERLYLYNSPVAREALLALLETAPMAPGWWRAMRHIYKAAEFRGDGPMFAVLAGRFATEPHRFNQYQSWRRAADATQPQNLYLTARGQYYGQTYTLANISNDTTNYGWGTFTQRYFKRRPWWFLNRLGRIGDPDYVRLAVGVLLRVSDDDADQDATRQVYDYTSWSWRSVHYSPFSRHDLFCRILYTHSTRFERTSSAWRSVDGWTPNDPVPNVREEAFPEMWEAVPTGLLHLLDESRCEEVHIFAARALRACTAFTDTLPMDALLMLLGSAYSVTAQLGYDLASARWNPASPDFDLLAAVADCAYEPARGMARRWFADVGDQVNAQPALLARVTASAYADMREFARDYLRGAPLSEDVERELVGRLVAAVMGMGDDDSERASAVAETVLRALPTAARQVSYNVIRDLVQHASPTVQEFGADLVLARGADADMIPWDVIYALLSSTTSSVRGIGTRVFGELSDAALLQREELLASLCVHPYSDLRDGVRRTVARLAAGDAGFAERIIKTLLDVFTIDERHEGVHASVAALLIGDLAEHLTHVDKRTVFKLLEVESPEGREVGGVLLGRNIDPADLTVAEMVRLADNEILTVREAGCAMLAASSDRVSSALFDALQTLESQWSDTRQWGFAFFRDAIAPHHWTPELMVSVCDSILPDVQVFGRELITRYFSDDDGPQYLLKLSEHPSGDLQLYATNYLERFASGDLERLRRLEPYFVTVLSQINRGRVAKDRVFAFLEREARASEEAAALVARIMARISATIAIGDRARSIEIMLAIAERHSEIALPLTLSEVEVRHGV